MADEEGASSDGFVHARLPSDATHLRRRLLRFRRNGSPRHGEKERSFRDRGVSSCFPSRVQGLEGSRSTVGSNVVGIARVGRAA